MNLRRNPLEAYRHVDWWLFLLVACLCVVSLAFLQSTTQDDPRFSAQLGKQALFVVTGLGIGLFAILPHYSRVLRLAWPIYALAVLGLLMLPVFGSVLNGSRRWYSLPGMTVQPSEFAKLAVIVALASMLRFERRVSFGSSLFAPGLVAGIPAALVLVQPDLGSTLVFVPITLAMCYAAGARGREVVLVVVLGLAAFVLAYFTSMHGYQKERVDVWVEHWVWNEDSARARELLRGPAYQPWQALIAMGSGGMTGFGLGQGPQNRYDFLPYRSDDYVFAVIGEEAGWLGAMGVLLLYAAIVFGLLRIARRTRERFGRLVCVGVAAWIGAQSLMHAAVCVWLVPSKGLPMPLVSYGGSSVLATLLAIALCLNVGARREPVLAGDGFR